MHRAALAPQKRYQAGSKEAWLGEAGLGPGHLAGLAELDSHRPGDAVRELREWAAQPHRPAGRAAGVQLMKLLVTRARWLAAGS